MKVRADLAKKLLSIGEASNYLGISIDTLRRWEKREKVEVYRSPGGHRYFKKEDLDNLFGSKYERDELAKVDLKSKSDEKTTKIEIADTATVTDQIKSEIDRPLEEKSKLIVPRYFTVQRPSKYDKLLTLSTNIDSISTPPLSHPSILEPSTNPEVTKKPIFLLSNERFGLVTISITIALIALITLLIIVFSPPKIISPIP